VLRPYQSAAIERAVECLTRGGTPIVVSPTGSGKTYTATELVRQLNRRTWWVAHRKELVDQAAERLAMSGLKPGYIMAGMPYCPAMQVQACSIQTLVRRKNLVSPELIIIDECHHAASVSYRNLPRVPTVGLTATPFRLDGKGLGSAGFTDIVVAAYTDELVAQSILVKPRVFAPPPPDLTGVHKIGGDYREDELEEAMNKPKLVEDIVKGYLRLGAKKKAVVFAVGIDHSLNITDQFNAAGVRCEHIDGTTPKPVRKAALDRLRNGELDAVSNCMILTEGWDLPALEVAIVARPTASLCLHLQMIGRIMRSAEGKDGALVIDHAGNTLRHGFVTDRINYSLDSANTVKRAAGTGLKSCPACWALVPTAARACQECGHSFVPQKKEIEHVDGELVEITAPKFVRAASFGTMVDFLRQRLQEQSAFGYRPGYAAARFNEEYGTWPPRDVVKAAENPTFSARSCGTLPLGAT